MTSVVGLGAGGHAEVLLEILQALPDHEVRAILSADAAQHGQTLGGVPIIGGDEKLEELRQQGIVHAFNGVGGFGRNSVHHLPFERARVAGFAMIRIFHPTAFVSPSAQVEEGCVVLAHAVVNTGARLGRNVIVNTAATVDHHCVLQDHVHIAPGAHLAGAVLVEELAQVGIGAVIRESVRIGRGAIVGAGAVVLRDVPPGATAVGNPARF